MIFCISRIIENISLVILEPFRPTKIRVLSNFRDFFRVLSFILFLWMSTHLIVMWIKIIKQIYSNRTTLMKIGMIIVIGLACLFSFVILIPLAGDIFELINSTMYDEKWSSTESTILFAVVAPLYAGIFVFDTVFLVVISALIYKFIKETSSEQRNKLVIRKIAFANLAMIIGNILRLPGVAIIAVVNRKGIGWSCAGYVPEYLTMAALIFIFWPEKTSVSPIKKDPITSTPAAQENIDDKKSDFDSTSNHEVETTELRTDA